MDAERLVNAFRESVVQEFSFLKREFGFSLRETKPRYFRYESAVTTVRIYHDSNFALHVEFSPAPFTGDSRDTAGFLLLRRRTQQDPKTPSPTYGMPEVLMTFVDPNSLPQDIGELFKQRDENPDAYRRWFVGETPGQIATSVRMLTELTMRFGIRLLQGDLNAFDSLRDHRSRESEKWKRRRLLKEHPVDTAATYEGLPTDEIERRCNEYQKSRILLKEGDAVADIKDLPAAEFLKQYVSRRLKRR